MAADATTILGAVVLALGGTDGTGGINAALAALDPGIFSGSDPILVRQLSADPEVKVLPGWSPGDPVPCWIVSMAKEEEDNRQSSTEHRSVDYPWRIDYVRAYVPGEEAEDSAIRDLRQLVRETLDMPRLTGAAQVWSTIWKDGPAYQRKTYGDTVLTVSVQEATSRVMEPRT